MGADLYIECKEAEEYAKRIRPLWDKAIAERDKLIASLGNQRDRETFKFVDSAVQEAQEKVEEISKRCEKKVVRLSLATS